MNPEQRHAGSRGRTVYARASGPGRSAVAVYRLSGPEAFAITARLSGTPLPSPRRAALRRFADPATGHTLDEGLVILFPGPSSFTGEDVAEFQLHGSLAVEADLYTVLSALGAAPAEPGEFTRRALINGKMDLAQVEGLGDLLDAETSTQRLQALGQYGGSLSARATAWRSQLLQAMAHFEASIDFADEADAPATAAAARAPLAALLAELRASRHGASAARVIREGFRVALIGAPNAGKSSLLNRLVGDERAIVAATPGTTRDVIEARLDLGGRLVSLFDTAGLRAASDDAIEREGMRRSLRTAADADLRLVLFDPFADVPRETPAASAWQELVRPGDIRVATKADLGATPGRGGVPEITACAPIIVSAHTGEGIDALVAAMSARLDTIGTRSESGPLTRERHVVAVTDAIDAIERALAGLHVAPELAAEDVRLAARALGRIVGAVDVEDVLGEIFSTFCIGK